MVKEQRDERHMFVLVAQMYINTEITNPALLMLRRVCLRFVRNQLST